MSLLPPSPQHQSIRSDRSAQARARAQAEFLRFRDHGGHLGTVYQVMRRELTQTAERVLGDPHLAEDVVQTTFLQARSFAGSFDAERPLRPWLNRVVENRSRDFRRAIRPPMPLSSVPEELTVAAERDLPERQCMIAELVDRVTVAIADLPSRYRAVLSLALLAEQSSAMIARRLGVPLPTVKTRRRRGLALLRSKLMSLA